MSLTSDASNNIVHRLRQLADEIDKDPTVVMIRAAVSVNRKSHQVLNCYVHIEREFDAAPPGALLAAELDKPS